MNGIWELVAKIGLGLISAFVKDLKRRGELEANFKQFIANRQTRANATIELKNNLEEQDADLDELQKQLEAESKQKEITNGKSESKI